MTAIASKNVTVTESICISNEQQALEEHKEHEAQQRIARKARLRNPKWNPRQWHPVYEEVVLMSMMGYSNKRIAEIKGFTAQHVHNIISTERANLIRLLMIQRMEAKREYTIEERLAKIQDKAMDRIENVLNDDDLAVNKPLGVFDRAITVLRGVGKLRNSDEGNVTNNIIVSSEAAERLAKAIKLSDKAQKLHAEVLTLPSGEVVYDVQD